MNASLSEKLIRICARPVDPQTRRRAALHLLDWMGCALIGSTAPAGLALAAYANSGSVEKGPCFLPGAAGGRDEVAAFVNGGLGNIFEMDDVHRVSILHAGDVVIPATLAMAQAEGASADVLLDAIVRGYEVAIRIGSAASVSGYSAWYNSGTCGVFGAAMASGSILALEPSALADALGQAGMQASGIWQCRLEPTFSKQLAAAQAARSGVVSARLAKTGFPGAKLILEGELGFFEAYYPHADRSAVCADPDGAWKISEVSFKPWSACRHAHPAIEAAVELRQSRSPDEIAAIEVSTYAAANDFCDNPQPASDHEARFSLQHCVAATLVRGVPGLDDFDEAARSSSSLAAMRQIVTLSNDDEFSARFPQAYGARVKIEYADSTTAHHTVTTAKGDPENPMNEQELIDKFMCLARRSGVEESNAGAMLCVVRELPASDTIDPLNDVLGCIAGDLHKRKS